MDQFKRDDVHRSFDSQDTSTNVGRREDSIGLSYQILKLSSVLLLALTT
jgi:hypothetical protein